MTDFLLIIIIVQLGVIGVNMDIKKKKEKND